MLAQKPGAARRRFLTLYDRLVGVNGVPARVNILVQTEVGPGSLSSPTANTPDVLDGAAVLAPPTLNISAPRRPRGELKTIAHRRKRVKRRLVPKDRDDTTFHAPADSNTAVAAPLGASTEETSDGVVQIERDREETASFLEAEEQIAEQVGSTLCPSEGELGMDCGCGVATCLAGAQDYVANAQLHMMRFREAPLDDGSFSAPCRPASTITVVTERFVCNRNGTKFERQTRPCPECPPEVRPDTSCSKSHPNRVYPPRPATYANLAYFRDMVCLFPKKTSNRFFPTLDWWLTQPASRS